MAQGKEGERRAWQAAPDFKPSRRDGKSTFPRLRKDCQLEKGC